MFTILKEVTKHRNEASGEFDLDASKIVCVTAMKALVRETAGNFNSRLNRFEIEVCAGNSQIIVTKLKK